MSEIPKAVWNKSEDCKHVYNLILWLDEEPFIEFGANTKPAFSKLLTEWKKKELPSLARSVYRVYIATEERIIEADI